jgi:hypothetical protein
MGTGKTRPQTPYESDKYDCPLEESGLKDLFTKAW